MTDYRIGDRVIGPYGNVGTVDGFAPGGRLRVRDGLGLGLCHPDDVKVLPPRDGDPCPTCRDTMIGTAPDVLGNLTLEPVCLDCRDAGRLEEKD
jgi:hypothetical protein